MYPASYTFKELTAHLCYGIKKGRNTNDRNTPLPQLELHQFGLARPAIPRSCDAWWKTQDHATRLLHIKYYDREEFTWRFYNITIIYYSELLYCISIDFLFQPQCLTTYSCHIFWPYKYWDSTYMIFICYKAFLFQREPVQKPRPFYERNSQYKIDIPLQSKL